MSKFSGAVQIAKLDDFITPSQECIKPVEVKKEPKTSRTGSKIRIEDDGSYVSVSDLGEKQKLARVDITLADCLACSGCITTAETVLVTQQSCQEMLRVLKNKAEEDVRLVVVSVATQAVLSMSAASDLHPDVCLRKLSGLFKRLGADLVIELLVGEDLVLFNETREFIDRLERWKSGDRSSLPMLSSTCPGWVCYAEKTKGHLLPNLSEGRSAQQLTGRLVKGGLAEKRALKPSQVYHISVQPCFDKKLEASRPQFADDDQSSKDVDCVVSPVELLEVLENECGEKGLSGEIEADVDDPWAGLKSRVPLSRPEGSGSGGFAQAVLKATSEHLGVSDIPRFINVRKGEVQVATLNTNLDEQPIKIAVVTGFRNIQNLVNKMKKGACDYHYIEVMACPSGCLNGGAQVRNQLKQVEKFHGGLEVRDPLSKQDGDLNELKTNWHLEDDKCKTSYEAVTYNPNPLTIKW